MPPAAAAPPRPRSIRSGCASPIGSMRIAMLVMIGSGWQIYNASPLFAFTFPGSDHARRLAGRRPALAFRRHVAAGRQRLVYVVLGLATGRFRRKLLPIRPAEVVRDVAAALAGRLSHDDLVALQRRAEAALCRRASLAGVVIVLRPRDLEAGAAAGADRPVRRLRGRARYVHFFCHGGDRRVPRRPCACMALLVPKSLRAMIRGRKEATCAASARSSPASIRAAHQGRGQAAARSVAAAVPAQRREPRRADAAHRLRHRRRRRRPRSALRKMSQFNDWVQARLFNPNRLAPTYPESAITRPFPFNGYYPEERGARRRRGPLQARRRRPGRQQAAVDARPALRAAAGDADHPAHLRRGLERDRQVDRRAAHGVPHAASAPTSPPNTLRSAAPRAIPAPIDMPTALHPQTQMTFKFDGEILPRRYGFPMRIRIPTKLGFKNPKYVIGIAVLNNVHRRLLGGPGLQLVQRALARAFNRLSIRS